jgi:phage protein D/phage baseplate assembly protein gpV
MPDPNALASQIEIKLDGQVVQPAIMSNLSYMVVEQHVHLPGMFILRFLDPAMEILDNGPFNLTKELEISAEKEDGSKIALFKGEITALEPEFKEGMLLEVVVRGFDKSHRLFRETISKAYLNIKDSDLANRIAGEAGLSAQVDATSTVYKHLIQHNQTNLEFLFERAWRIGYECFVADGKLYFRKPPAIASAELELRWGEDLQEFYPRMSLAEQVDEVNVKGWDPDKMQAIVGQASRGNLYPKIGEPKNGAQFASSFGKGKKIVVDQPVVDQAEANTLAQARLNESSGAFVEAEGVALRRPDLQAGKVVELKALGNRFSGKYLISSATHTFSPEGFATHFSVRGARTGMLSEEIALMEPLDRWPGLVEAVVTNTDDPQDLGRVKVKYPWLAEDVESYWARVIGIGAGPEAGFFAVPQVNDEVVVAFVHGDFNHPVVIGGLWNSKNAIPKQPKDAPKGQKQLVRSWHSPKGHRIVLDDTSAKKIEIVTTDGRSITLTDQDKKIILKTMNVELILEDQKLSVETATEINIKAGSNLKMEANGNMDLKASGQLNIKGAMVNIN